MRHVIGLLLRIAIALPLALVLFGSLTAALLADSLQSARQRASTPQSHSSIEPI